MPSSSPAQAPVKSIDALGSNFSGVGVHGAATTGLGLELGVPAADGAADATAADAVVDADGVSDAEEEPHAARQAQRTPISTK